MQGTGRAIAEEVQRLLGRARAQAAAAAAPREAAAAAARADESDAGANDSEAPREGEPAADTLEDRIKRRCVQLARHTVYRRGRSNSRPPPPPPRRCGEI